MLDPAVAKIIGVDPQDAIVSSAGGGGCSSASTYKIASCLQDGTEKVYFMKTGNGREAEVMFEGLFYALNMIECAWHAER